MSASTSQRRSTLHDLATLRLHPDGKRVPIISPPRVGPYASRRRNIGRDTRGNRMARDAAGLGVVPKRLRMLEDDGGGENLLGGTDASNDETKVLKSSGRQRGKRRRIDSDVEFLGDSGRSVLVTGDANMIGPGEMSWPAPSSVRSFPLSLHAIPPRSFISFGVSGPVEMRALLRKPVLRRPRPVVKSVAHIQS
jgi:hypothetical protein